MIKVRPSEHEEQKAVVTWAKIMTTRYPELELIYAIPNGAKLPYVGKGKNRYSPQAMKLKAEGLHPGIPDLCLPVNRHGYGALYIEMKVGYNKPSPEQESVITKLRSYENCVYVCYSADEAIGKIKEYLDIPITGEY